MDGLPGDAFNFLVKLRSAHAHAAANKLYVQFGIHQLCVGDGQQVIYEGSVLCRMYQSFCLNMKIIHITFFQFWSLFKDIAQGEQQQVDTHRFRKIKNSTRGRIIQRCKNVVLNLRQLSPGEINDGLVRRCQGTKHFFLHTL